MSEARTPDGRWTVRELRWAAQFECEEHGVCTPDMVMTTKCCIKCTPHRSLIRGTYPDADEALALYAERTTERPVDE